MEQQIQRSRASLQPRLIGSLDTISALASAKPEVISEKPPSESTTDMASSESIVDYYYRTDAPLVTARVQFSKKKSIVDDEDD